MGDGGKDVHAVAHQKVQMILAQHYPPEALVSRQVIEELDALVEDARVHPERFETERYQLEKDT